MAKIRVVQMAGIPGHPWQYLDDQGRVWIDAAVTYHETAPDGTSHNRRIPDWQLLDLPEEPEPA
ncbi:MAG: hypothetical protein ACLGIF_05220 [Actinomycetes bacterium]